MKQMTEKQMAVRIANPGGNVGTVGAALQAALAKRQEREHCTCPKAAGLGIDLGQEIPPRSPDCNVKAHRVAYDLHETACNIAEDFDGGHIFQWRLDQIKECLMSGGTTAIDEHGEISLVDHDGEPWRSDWETLDRDLCPGCAAAERDGIKTTCGGRC